MTKIIRCTCNYPMQDELYGKGMRVHNATADPAKNGYRCTVCLKCNKPEA